jgi:phospholipid/cholesterol/gamma-HCH transport system substrate-binding protein
MRKKEWLPKFWAGLFFVACIVLFVVAVFTIGSNKGFGEPKFPITALFKNVGGLYVGASVRLAGVNVGSVSDISFLDEEIEGRTVKVTMNIYKKYQRQLYKCTKIAIITEGVLGEKIIEISVTPGFRRDSLAEPIIGEDPLDVQNLAETFGQVANALLESTKNIETIITQMENISITTKRLLNRIEQRVIDGSLFKVF